MLWAAVDAESNEKMHPLVQKTQSNLLLEMMLVTSRDPVTIQKMPFLCVIGIMS